MTAAEAAERLQEQGIVTKLLGALLTAGVIAWAASITATVSKVTGLEPQIEQIQRDVGQHDDWIARWPTEGELAADVRQTRDIEFLFQEMEELNDSIDALRLQIQRSN